MYFTLIILISFWKYKCTVQTLLRGHLCEKKKTDGLLINVQSIWMFYKRTKQLQVTVQLRWLFGKIFNVYKKQIFDKMTSLQSIYKSYEFYIYVWNVMFLINVFFES